MTSTYAPMEHDWRDVLLKAASIVEEGWCQGFLVKGPRQGWRESQQHCATGAINRASYDLLGEGFAWEDKKSPMRALADSLGEEEKEEGMTWLSVAQWNDKPGRTAAEVAAAMRQAATA